MNIIEREIARREALIEEKETKEEQILELEDRLAELRADVDRIDDRTLAREIEELKRFLPFTA